MEKVERRRKGLFARHFLHSPAVYFFLLSHFKSANPRGRFRQTMAFAFKKLLVDRKAVNFLPHRSFRREIDFRRLFRCLGYF